MSAVRTSAEAAPSGEQRNGGPPRGLGLLNLSAWMRRQPFLQMIYRRLPQSFRDGVSQVMAAPATRDLHFPHTSRWNNVPAPACHAFSGTATAQTRINVFAYARGQFGLGESARMYARALIEAGCEVAVHDVVVQSQGQNDTSLETHLAKDPLDAVNLVFVNPDFLEEALRSIGDRLGRRYTIACWFWELENFPEEWRPAFDMVDEVMVASRFVADLVARASPKPILHVPQPLSDISDSGLTRTDFGIEEESFVFLHTFDFSSFVDRKNPFGVIDAFLHAFPAGDEKARLLVKSSNGYRHPDKLLALLNRAAADPRITVRDEVIDRSHLHALQRCADVFVSLHRAEGLGLGLAESMRMGKPVIGTGWSGNLEFMDTDNSCLVDYTLVPVGKDQYLHWENQRWAEPDIGHAASHMRHLYEDRPFARQLGERAARDVRARLDPRLAARHIIERISDIDWRQCGSDAAPQAARKH